VLAHRGVELLLLKKVIGDQLETEERAASDHPSAQLPDALWKAVDFVPGSASVGQLRERHQTVGNGDPCTCSAADCRCLCHRTSRTPSFGVDQSTNTDHRPELADKAVNTKARGLMHQNGSGNGGRRTTRSVSVDIVSTAQQQQHQRQQPTPQ